MPKEGAGTADQKKSAPAPVKITLALTCSSTSFCMLFYLDSRHEQHPAMVHLSIILVLIN